MWTSKVRVALRGAVLAALVGACASTTAPEGPPLTPQGGALVVSDETMVKACQYLGDVNGAAATADGARNDACNRAAPLGATNILFVSVAPGAWTGPYAKTPIYRLGRWLGPTGAQEGSLPPRPLPSAEALESWYATPP